MTPRVTIACTVKNEERSLPALLEGLLAQTLPPAEIVVVDGGSSDQTMPVLQRYVAQGHSIRAITVPGACRGRGRNVAIAEARTELVALIDGGCVPEPTWLEQLVAMSQAHPSTDVVFGVVRPITETFFTECSVTATLAMRRLPSGQRIMSESVASILMRRSAWERVGKFVEGLRTGEDLLFVQQLRRSHVGVGLAPGAVVHWQIPRTLRSTFHRFVTYAHFGLDAGLGHTWHYRTYAYWTMAVLLGGLAVGHSWWWLVLLGVLGGIRVLRKVLVHGTGTRGLRALAPHRVLFIGWIVLAVDVATLCGTLRWLREVWTARPTQAVSS